MTRRSSSRRLIGTLLAGAAIGVIGLSAQAAAAQTDAAQTPDAQSPATAPVGSRAAAADAGQIDELVVTAQKRTERLQDVPASVSVVNTENLAQQGLVRFEDYAAQVPGMSLTTAREGQAQVTLRGITTGPAQSASATSFYIDEAPIGSVNAYTAGSSLTPDLDPSSLAQVEVLKGPQGTLYGAGSVGGLLKFVTAQPDFEAFGGHASFGVSTVDHGGTGTSERLLVNLPVLKDKLVLRLSGFDRTDPGYIDNVQGDNSNANKATVRGARAVLSAKLSDTLRVDLSAMSQNTHAFGSNVVDVDGALKPIYGDLTQRRFTDEPGRVAFRLYNGTVHGQVGQIKLVSSTTYQTIKSSSITDGTLTFGALLGGIFGIPDLGFRDLQTTETKRFSQEFRADTTTLNGKLDAQVGLYFTHENDRNRVPSFSPFSTTTGAAYPLPNIVTAAILSRYTEYSVFGNATYHVTDQFDVLAGVRYSIDHQHYYQDYAGLIVGPERINTAGENGHIATFLVSPRYKFTRDSMIYARVASGYRPGGPNAVPPPSVYVAPDTFSPDKLTSYEVGFKGAFFNRMLTVDVAAFYTDWKDVQIQTSAGGFNFFVNGGAARSEGAELTARLTPVHGLVLGLNAAYTNAKLTSDAPAAGGVDGDYLPFVPRWSGSLTADYTFPLTEGLDGVLSGSLNYTGDRVSDFSAHGGREVPTFTTLNLRAGVQHDNWTLSLYAKNIGDSRGITVLSSETLVPGGSPLGAAVIQPRTFGAQVDLNF